MGRLLRAVGLVVAFGCAGLVSETSALHALSPPEGPPAYCTIFNHMVKSGGTSVKDQLYSSSRKHGQNRPGLCTSDGRTTNEDCLNALHNSSIILGYGELLRKPLEHLGRECDFFTMLREPVDRLVSAFFYCPEGHDIQRKPIEWCGDADLDEPATSRLVDFATRRWGNKAFSQMMMSLKCPFFYQDFCETQDEVPPPNLFSHQSREAMMEMEKMLESYVAVGIAEHWELSMQLFDATVKSPVDTWDPHLLRNPGHDSAKKREVLDWARTSPEIHTLLAADVMLYEFALEVFKQQTSTHLGTVW